MNSKTNSIGILILAASVIILPFATGCMRSDYTPQPVPPEQAPVPDLPEPHGPMEFTPEIKESPQASNDNPGSEPTPLPDSTPSTTTPIVNEPTLECGGAECPPPAAEPQELPVQNVPVSKRHPLCTDSYDATQPQLKDVVCPRCQRGEFVQPQPKRAKIDILFVADSSPSLETERTVIAKGVRQFIEALPEDADFHIAVMAAHSDISYDGSVKRSGGLAGKLLVRGNEPAVLKKSELRDWSRISQMLLNKLTKMKGDPATDGGEAGLYSLDKGISEPLLSENKRLGFFRDDAALAVVFISDENDLCSYGVNYPAGVVPKVNVNKYPGTEMTVEERANQAYCRDQDGNPTITSRSVFLKLRELKRIQNSRNGEAMPLLLSGILYTEEASVPTVMPPNEKYPEYFWENEVGYGYLDLIKENEADLKEVTVDISKENFDEGLRQIGKVAARKLEVKSAFQLPSGLAIDEETLCVLVDDREVERVSDFYTPVDGLTYLFKDSHREVQLRGIGRTNARGDSSKVEIFYCEPPSVIEYNPEKYNWSDLPTKAEHYRNLPVPSRCQGLKKRITSGALDAE